MSRSRSVTVVMATPVVLGALLFSGVHAVAVAEARDFRGTLRQDILTGTDGDDRFVLFKGDDRVDGRAGRDRIKGDAGDDRLIGGDGNDRIDGGSGDDALIGGAGNDRIDGGRGNDRISGGAGNDLIEAGSQRGPNVVRCGDGIDTVKATRQTTVSADCERVTGFPIRVP